MVGMGDLRHYFLHGCSALLCRLCVDVSVVHTVFISTTWRRSLHIHCTYMGPLVLTDLDSVNVNSRPFYMALD